VTLISTPSPPIYAIGDAQTMNGAVPRSDSKFLWRYDLVSAAFVTGTA
jgi:hypothetical protein